MRTTTMYLVMSDELISYPGKVGKFVGSVLKNPRDFSMHLERFQKEIKFNYDFVLSGSFGSFDRIKKIWPWTGGLQNGNPLIKLRPDITIPYKNLPKANSNGLVRFTDFKASMDEILGISPAGRIDSPIFAVIDHNSTHHMSYILARKAYSTASNDLNRRKKVVINFDNHGDGPVPDKQSYDPNYIKCGDWAYHLFLEHSLSDAESDPAKKDPAVNPVYISVGAHLQSLWRGGEIGATQIYYEDVTRRFSAPALTDSNIEEIMGIISELVSPHLSWDNADVYITVDRDFMIGSYTPYKDGFYSPLVGRLAVANCLSYLSKNHANLVGFDVIGLPSEWGSSSYKREEAVEEAIIDTWWFYNSVSHYGEPRISDTLRATMPVERS